MQLIFKSNRIRSNNTMRDVISVCAEWLEKKDAFCFYLRNEHSRDEKI